jgi:transcriptional regulator with XRE-family HTH domain
MESLNNELVIGEKIKEVFESSDIRIGDFADQLGMVRQNVYRIFERTHIDTGLLLKISALLNHDFFQYYTRPQTIESPESKNPKTKGANEGRAATEITALAEELSRTKAALEAANKEIMYLKKIIDLMEERARWLESR